jgi:ABC-type transporter Mla subunit MlaD
MTMAGKTNRWKLGLFVIAGTALAVVIVVWLGAGRRHDVLTIQCYFDEPVQGLDVGSIASHRGVPIGVVSKIRIAEEDPRREWIRVDIDVYWDVLVVLVNLPPELRDMKSLPALRDFAQEGKRVWRAQLQSSLLTGVTHIQTDLFDASKHPTPKYPFDPPPDTLHTVPSGTRILMDDLSEALDAVPGVAKKLMETLGNVDKFLATADQAVVDLRVADLSKRLDRLLADADKAVIDLDTKELSSRAGQALTEARDALKEVRELAADLRSEGGPIRRFADTYVRLGDDADKAIVEMDLPGTSRSVRETLGRHVDPAADEVSRLASDLRNEVIYVRRMLESITRLADTLERDPSSVLRGREPPEPIQERK